MEVNDSAVMTALVEMMRCFDELQPNILGNYLVVCPLQHVIVIIDFSGLGLCAVTEFGRILNYNLLVDGERDGEPDDSEDEADEVVDQFRGYKQCILILNSQEVETGKSFLAELLLRIYHGRKVAANSTLSFDSAKEFLRKGEPIVIGKSGIIL